MTSASLKAIARELIMKNAKTVFLASIMFFAVISILSWLRFRLPGTLDLQNMYDRLLAGDMLEATMIYRNFRSIGVVLSVALYLFQPVLDAGYISHCMKLGRGQEADYKDSLNGFQYFLKVISIFFLTTIFIFLWSLLLIIPGIVAAYKYRLAYYIMFDDPGKSALQCIRESKAMMNGHKVDLLIIDISFIGWYVLDFAIVMLTPLPYMPQILQIWILPYRGLVNAGFYEDCKSTLTV